MNSMIKLLAYIMTSVILLSCVSVCIAAEERITYGDTDGDGNINIVDVVFMLKHIAKWDMSKQLRNFNEEAADVTQDGVIDIFDVVKTLKYIAGWGYMLGKPREANIGTALVE